LDIDDIHNYRLPFDVLHDSDGFSIESIKIPASSKNLFKSKEKIKKGSLGYHCSRDWKN
jgi:hypothetical protein